VKAAVRTKGRTEHGWSRGGRLHDTTGDMTVSIEDYAT
jgi:hypothetical protein